jgi:hypothetical protein
MMRRNPDLCAFSRLFVAIPRAHTAQNQSLNISARKDAKEQRSQRKARIGGLLGALGPFASWRAIQCPAQPHQILDAFETLTTYDDATCRLRKNKPLLRPHSCRLRKLPGFFTLANQRPTWKCPPHRSRRSRCTPQSLVLYKPPSPKLPVFCCSVLSLALNTDTVPMRTLFGVMRERWDSRTRRNLTASSRLRAPCYSPPSCIESVSIR